MACTPATYKAAYDAMFTLDDARRLAAEGPLSFDALVSILSNKMVKQTKLTAGHHRQPDVCKTYVQRYLRGETLLTIARDLRLPPTMLARFFLEHQQGLKKGSKEVGKLIKQPSLILDNRLSKEVADAVEADPFYGPRVETLKRVIGLEYEHILYETLRSRGIPFLTENDLRANVEARTPDALLRVPLFVRGRQVHWIDSKGTFGDPDSHRQSYESQFSAYLNRFGAGLVVYWMGYEESVVHLDPKVLVLDHMPVANFELMSHFASQP